MIKTEQNTVKTFFKNRLKGVKAKLEKRYQGHNFAYFWNGDADRKKVGIYLRGACDLGAVFACEPFIQEQLNGTTAIYRSGYGAASTRTDILLQTLDNYPDELIETVTHKMKLNNNYFAPDLFEKEIVLPGPSGDVVFPKSVIILSMAPDLVRNAYRHREHDFIIDPGGWWLNQNMANVLKDLSAVNWLNENFRKIGKISLEESRENFRKLITLLRQETGCHNIIIFNILGLEPGERVYNYQFVRNPQVIRRRQFNMMLSDLSREMDFSIIDVDKILKSLGVKEQVDFAHWPIDRFEPVAREVHRVMNDMKLFD
ncbi:MAG: hypothetical protein AAF490_01090 [Chloroflexota bacterium]